MRTVQLLYGWTAFASLTELVRRNSARPQVVRMFVTLCAEAMDPEHPAHDWIQEHYADGERTLTAAIDAGVADGSMRADMPAITIARLTLSIMDGLQLQWLASEGRLDMAGEFEAYVDAPQGRTWARSA